MGNLVKKIIYKNEIYDQHKSTDLNKELLEYMIEFALKVIQDMLLTCIMKTTLKRKKLKI